MRGNIVLARRAFAIVTGDARRSGRVYAARHVVIGMRAFMAASRKHSTAVGIEC